MHAIHQASSCVRGRPTSLPYHYRHGDIRSKQHSTLALPAATGETKLVLNSHALHSPDRSDPFCCFLPAPASPTYRGYNISLEPEIAGLLYGIRNLGATTFKLAKDRRPGRNLPWNNEARNIKRVQRGKPVEIIPRFVSSSPHLVHAENRERNRKGKQQAVCSSYCNSNGCLVPRELTT